MIRLRELSTAERAEIEKLARSRTAPARQVERAQIVLLAQQHLSIPTIARQLRLHHQTVRSWLKRFNAGDLQALNDRPRPGKPPTYTTEQVSEVISVALTNPKELGLPFACWTLDRLEAYLNEQRNIPIKRSRIDEILIAEGLRWRHQETWFGERVDPDFAKKRGASRRSIPPRQKTAW